MRKGFHVPEKGSALQPMMSVRTFTRLLQGYTAHSLRSPDFLMSAFLAFAAVGLDLNPGSSAGWLSVGEFGRHVYGLSTLLGPLVASLMLWRLARLDQALDEVVELRTDHELGPLAARALGGALAAVLAIGLGVCGVGLVHQIGQPFTWSGWPYAVAYLARSAATMLVWTGLATAGIAATRSPWGAFALPLLTWIVAFAPRLPAKVSEMARFLVLTDAAIVSPMNPWGVGFVSAAGWVGAFLLGFLGLLGLAASVQRVHRCTFRAGTAAFTLLCWGGLPLYLAVADPVPAEVAFTGAIQTRYPVTHRSASDPVPAKAGMEALATGTGVLYRPAGKPVPDELLPVYRTVRSWIEQAPWETGIADVWVLPDFNLLSYPVETFVDGSNLIVDEDLLRQFRVADRLSIAVKLTEPLPVNRPARIYLALWLLSGGQEREIRPLLAFLEHYMATGTTSSAGACEGALAWDIPDDELGRLAWGDRFRPIDLSPRDLSALPGDGVVSAPALAAEQYQFDGPTVAAAEERQHEVLFSMLHRWNPAFHQPHQFSALDACLVLRHWEAGEEQGHERYIAGRLAELQHPREAE